MSRWSHSICDDCWPAVKARMGEPEKQPYRLIDRKREQCCFCGKAHTSGIRIQDSPSNCLFGGNHEEGEESLAATT